MGAHHHNNPTIRTWAAHKLTFRRPFLLGALTAVVAIAAVMGVMICETGSPLRFAVPTPRTTVTAKAPTPSPPTVKAHPAAHPSSASPGRLTTVPGHPPTTPPAEVGVQPAPHPAPTSPRVVVSVAPTPAPSVVPSPSPTPTLLCLLKLCLTHHTEN